MRRWVVPLSFGSPSFQRGLRVAIVMPSVFALLFVVIDDPIAATFGAFGSFALLVFADFGGEACPRAIAYLGATVIGVGLLSLGTLVSGALALAVGLMVAVGFAIRFVGVFGGTWAAGGAALTLAYVLAATLPGPVSEIPDRAFGWCFGGVVATTAALVLWPRFERSEIRARVAAVVRAAARLIRVRWVPGADGTVADAEHEAEAAVTEMRGALAAATLRPSGPGERDRALVALVEGAGRLVDLLHEAGPAQPPDLEDDAALARRSAAVLDHAAAVIEGADDEVELAELEAARAANLDAVVAWTGARLRADAPTDEVFAQVETLMWPRIASYLTLGIAADVAIARGGSRIASTVAASLHTPVVAFGSLRERVRFLLAAHTKLRSARFADALRAGIGLGVAVLVAGLLGVDHGFWVVLGTLAVLRSSAMATGRTAVQAVGGTVLGFVIIVPFVEAFGGDTTALWIMLPLVTFLAAYAPSAISFLVGQAAFTAFVVVLFNVVEAEGVATAVTRVEDVAIGAAVSLVVGILLWPRGARSMLRRAVVDLCRSDAEFLEAAMARVVGEPINVAGPETDATEAGLRAAEAFDQVRTDPGYAPASAEPIAAVTVTARRVRGVSEMVLTQSRLGFVVDAPAVRDALRAEAHLLADALRADAAAIDGTGAVTPVPALPTEVRDACGDALAAWGGRDDRGQAALGSIMGWEWLHLVHHTLVRAEPGVVAMAAVAERPWWR